MAHKTTAETVVYRQIIVTEFSIKDTDVPYFGTTVALEKPRNTARMGLSNGSYLRSDGFKISLLYDSACDFKMRPRPI